MHTGITAVGGRVRLTVAEFAALDLSDLVYRPLSAPTGNGGNEVQDLED
ncbi:MAG: hypothetical protein JJU29_10855 [Verrucomicrobia bacterium]|nr:hypothetical protein [Verrucomicrobiota bacterium]MCH8512510.1 hypothetical protein [Kiritimatiellia bacterium]